MINHRPSHLLANLYKYFKNRKGAGAVQNYTSLRSLLSYQQFLVFVNGSVHLWILQGEI